MATIPLDPTVAPASPFHRTPDWFSPAKFTNGVAAGDVDGDGDLDLVCANEGQSALYGNDGNGLSGVPQYIQVAYTTSGAALGDVDGDGDLDLVCANDGPNTLHLYEGSSFSALPVWTSNPSLTTMSVALGDLDGDGDLDLVCGNDGQSDTAYRNDRGAAVFTPVPVWTSTRPDSTNSIALGDLDGDGDLDLVCGNDGQSDTAYRNDGGILSADPAWSSGAAHNTKSLALGDVDGDGWLDLVCGNSDQSNTLYRNEGGTFSTDPAWSSARTDSTWSIALGDVDGDGDLDLACGNTGHSTVGLANTLYRNDGGVLTADSTWSSQDAYLTQSVALADVDGDGHLDLLCGNRGEANTRYANVAPAFSATPDWLSGPSYTTLHVTLEDVDGDTDLDLACGNSGQVNTLYRNDDGALTIQPVWSSMPDNLTRAVAFGDVDGDDDPDLVFGNNESSTLYRNDRGDGLFTLDPVWTSPSAAFPPQTNSVQLGDLDGDLDLDLVCGNRNRSNTAYRNEGGPGVFSPDTVWASGPALETAAVALGDVDRDGDLDLACGNNGEENALYRNDGGTFTWVSVWLPASPRSTLTVALGDTDGDGDLDLVCGNLDQANSLFRNDGGPGVFMTNAVWSSASPLPTQAVALEDLDGDGLLDLVCGNASQPGNVYRNAGGVFSLEPVWSSAPPHDATRSIALGDLDGDGDPDLVSGNLNEQNTAYAGLRNPPYRGNPLSPTHQLPNNAAHLRFVAVTRPSVNVLQVQFTAIDVESDPVWVLAEYQYEGAPPWRPVRVVGSPSRIGPLDSSPGGTVHQFDWDTSLESFDERNVILRLRTISHPSRAGLIQIVPAYFRKVGPVVPIRPEIVAAADSLRFPTVTVGDSSSVSFPVSNSGTGVLTVESMATPSVEMVNATPIPFDVAPGDTAMVTVRLEPRSELAITGDVVLHSNDPLRPAVAFPVRTDIRDLEVETNALAQSPEIPLGEAFTIQVIPADQVVVERGALFHRPALAGAVTDSIELVPSGASLIGVIPGIAVTEAGVEFWVEVENSGLFRRDPPGAPVDSVFFQAVQSPTTMIVTQSPTSGSEFFAGEAIAIEVELPQGSRIGNATLRHREGGEAAWMNEVPLSPFDSRATGMIPAGDVGARGVEYWIEVQTRTAVLTDPPSDPEDSPRVVRTVITDLEEESPSPGSRYRIFTTPLETSAQFQGSVATLLSDQPEFGSYDPLRWRLFRYDPAGLRNVEHSEDEVPRFRPEPGRAFWLISLEEHRIDTAPVEGLSTPTDEPFVVVLERGWNQVGNPFAFPVARSAIVRSDTTVGPLHAFDPSLGSLGGYVDAPAALRPFVGYFVKNESAEAETLWIPPVESGAEGLIPVAGPPEDGPPPVTEWQLRVEARAARSKTGTVVLGVRADASEGPDSLDRARPPLPPGRWVQAAIANREWGARSGLYRRDLRDPVREGHTWHVEIRTGEPAEEVTLEGFWDSGPPGDLALRIIDLEQGASGDIRSGETARAPYRLVSLGPDRPYRLALLAGSERYVAREGDRLVQIPLALTLDRNAPNPFREITRIRFGLPRPSSARLTVYNLEGRRIADLVDGRVLPAGYHTALWDGRDSHGRHVATGVYFYRLEGDGGSRSGKMLVIR